MTPVTMESAIDENKETEKTSTVYAPPKSEKPYRELPAEELIAKGRAPVNKQYLRDPGTRLPVGLSTSNGADYDDEAEKKDAANKVSVVKKSKRQQKKDRQMAKKSAANICSTVARAKDVNACPYGNNCSLNHDLDAFMAQKPPDLPGNCPFVAINRLCPYGLACRFAGTHSETQESVFEGEDPNEVNALNKDLQKRLWKKLASFPRADANLKSMGLLGKAKKLASNNEGAEDPENDTNVQKEETELPASKKSKVEYEDDKNVKTDSENNKAESKTIANAEKDQMITNTDKDDSSAKTTVSDDYVECKLTMREKKLVDFRGKLYVAPLTTVGNLPFRRVCKQLGADITCGEMAMSINLLQGQASEWALLRRHQSEDVFGVQICGAYPDVVARTAEMIDKECEVDFIDVNVGCPIDIVVNRGAGSFLLTRPSRLKQIVRAASNSIDTPLTLKVRTGYFEGKNCVQSFIGDLYDWGASALTIHGRTRQQRYSKLADWNYIYDTCKLAPDGFQVIGNGDIFSYTDWNEHVSRSNLSTCMIARGVLIKPWLLSEIKEQRHWDITASERFEILKDYVRFGLEHWGSDSKGVETTRHFLLEWLSYMHRYIPVGLLEVIPQKLNWRPPLYYGRNDLETIMASDSAADWVRISEMLLGPAPANFTFTPRHKSNAYDRPENG